MKLALFGDPYYVRMILNNARYVYKNCTSIYVPDFLNENNIDSMIDIRSIEKSEKNLDYVDEIITLYRDNSIPLPVKKLLNKTSKAVSINNININNIQKSFQRKEYNSKLLHRKPTILSLSMGAASQQYQIELLINRYLKNMGLNFHQCYSPESLYLLKKQNFNNSCLKIYENYRCDYDLFVGGINVSNINGLINEKSVACNLIRKMHPDTVVISCNAAPSYINNNIYHAIELLKYRYNARCVIVAISEYYYNESLNVSIKVPSETINSDHSFYYLPNFDKTTETKFIGELLSSVYLPDGVFPV